MRNLEETFTYDNQNRLTEVRLGTTQTGVSAYDGYGRMYDPIMSSFLSVDQYVQSPENAQGFNRYAYCMNNPLLKAFSGLNKAQKIAAISKEGVALSRMTKGLGVAGAAVSSGISVYQMANYRINGGTDSNVYIKGTLDLIMTGVSFIGPIGFAIGMTYFIVDLSTDSFGGWGKIP